MFCPEDGSIRFLWNVCTHLCICMVWHLLLAFCFENLKSYILLIKCFLLSQAVKRLQERNNLTENDAKARIAALPSNTEFAAKAHVVMSTYWSPRYTQKQVERAWKSLQLYLAESVQLQNWFVARGFCLTALKFLWPVDYIWPFLTMILWEIAFLSISHAHIFHKHVL
jgi:Dephospho-CoA kinase